MIGRAVLHFAGEQAIRYVHQLELQLLLQADILLSHGNSRQAFCTVEK